MLKFVSGAWVCADDISSTGTNGGTVTNVTAGLGLTGGSITTSGTVAIDPAVVPQLGAANTFSSTQTLNGGATVTTVSGTALFVSSSDPNGRTLQVQNSSTGDLAKFSGSGNQGFTIRNNGYYDSPGWGREDSLRYR